MRRCSENAVALIMTLIMLSVITVVAVAFLALTQRERTSVSQSTYQSEAEIMADTAFERAKGNILAQILARTNLLEADMMVSRNFINTNGFDANIGVRNLTNVNYGFRRGGGALSLGDVQQNIANLFYDPRPPVFINTNTPGQPPIMDFRFYLDLNRNGHFETNGVLPELDDNGRPIPDQEWIRLIGDPEWVGVLENPDFPHSRSNKFVGRYAYLVLPIGKSLDINYIHNHAKNPTDQNGNWFFRNQGYGSWEINLAAFLADLNANIWNPQNGAYFYNTNPILPSSGVAFDHAREMLNMRRIFQPSSANAVVWNGNDFLSDGIDNYANGPLDVLGRGLVDLPNAPYDDRPVRFAWPGAFNPTNYYTPHDFFELFPPNGIFPAALRAAGDGTAPIGRFSSYNRYTFYRMLAQLSTGSAAELPHVQVAKLREKIGARRAEEYIAEPLGKININYDNISRPSYEMTNWTSTNFFNTVADVLIRAQFTNASIMHYPATNYNFILHRLLQVAANIHDSTRGDSLPTVYRPAFIISNGVQYINGYYEDADVRTLANWQRDNTNAVPLVVGAKKWLPNFNEFAVETAASAGRKLEFIRTATNVPPSITNHLYILSISNFFAVEAWNSYTQNFTAPVNITVSNLASLALKDSQGRILHGGQFLLATATNVNNWSNYPISEISHPRYTNSFIVPFRTNFFFLPESVFRFPATFQPFTTNAAYDNAAPGFPVPDWKLHTTNRLTFIMSITNRIIDYAELTFTNMLDITRELAGGVNRPAGVGLSGMELVDAAWNTNRIAAGAPSEGLIAQINISLGRYPLADPYWRDFASDAQVGSGQDRAKSIHSFNEFMFPNATTTNANLRQQAPYTPGRRIKYSATFQVNDPMVHHMVEHLIGATKYWDVRAVDPSLPDISPFSLGDLNQRYQPWRGNPKRQMQETAAINWGLKDPGVTRSDYWEFPTNKFPSIGWLGKVHRGTPWQTIYLKAATFNKDPQAPGQVWRDHFNDTNLLAHPTIDWGLLDVFTTAVHPNASHGQLSINQTNFAAWSAVLSGVVVLENLDPGEERYEMRVIEPNSPELRTIYEGIQKTLDLKQGPNKDLARTFRRLGDILEVEELTVMSPFLDRNEFKYPELGINDAAMERIPQQILSLLKVGDPRFVVYAFGQSLRPAEQSILTSGNYIGMCTNYQITGEAVTRTVLQIRGSAGQDIPDDLYINAPGPRPVIETFNLLRSD